MLSLKTYEDLYDYAGQHSVDEVKKLLREYVTLGQPDDFMPEFTTRAMCRCAGHGLDGSDVKKIPKCYTDTKHGLDLYFHMWGLEE